MLQIEEFNRIIFMTPHGNGLMGPFNGKVGTVAGYMWNDYLFAGATSLNELVASDEEDGTEGRE